MLGCSRTRLACRLGLSETSVRAYETGTRVPRALDLMQVREFFEAAGIVFNDEGAPSHFPQALR